ncbi:MAG: beta-lactamase family protein [Anaerolineaceae bacterium]|nr:beta-lactamase family protein [Anaerolineaceae bacterium]
MADIFTQTDEIFSKWDKKDSPGCVLGIIKDGQFIYKRGYGLANLEYSIPLSPHSILDIGSTSKQFTALCILLLSRKGKISLDDPIQKYIPELPEYEAPVTIQHLVHHTSGIRDYLELMYFAGMPFENDYQEPEIISLIARQKQLNFIPGEEFLYSNSGYLLMAEIVKRVSGKDLRDFAQENIFAPLKMTQTHFHNNFKEIVKNRASAYAPLGSEVKGFKIDMGIFDVLGDGALYTSVEDLFLWDQNYYHNILDGGGQDLIQAMEEKFSLNSGEIINYAFGLDVTEYKGLKLVRHGGAWYGYRAEMLRFPEHQFSVICLANLGTMNPTGLALQVADLYLAEALKETMHKKEEEFIELSNEALKSFTGFYQNEDATFTGFIRLIDDQLLLDFMGEKIKIKPIADNQCKTIDFSHPIMLSFGKLGENGFQSLNFNVADAKINENLVKCEQLILSNKEIARYTGTYFQDELQVTYEILIVENELQIHIKGSTFETLQPVTKEIFAAGRFTTIFQFDSDENISGFNIKGSRARTIEFSKQ